MKINYNDRAFFVECVDNDVQLVLKIFSDLNLRCYRVCEIPCNKDRNIILTKYCKELKLCDINHHILNETRKRHDNIANLSCQICDITNISEIEADIIISLRQALQMFSLDTMRKMLLSARKNNNLKWMVFDVYDFKSKINRYSPSYLRKACPVTNSLNKEMYIRKSVALVEDNSVILKHYYYLNKDIIYFQEIKMFNHSFKDVESLLDDLKLKYTTPCRTKNYKIYRVGVK